MAKLPGSARRSNGGHSAAHHIAYADQRITKNARPLGKPQATTKASHQLAYPPDILVPMGQSPGPAGASGLSPPLISLMVELAGLPRSRGFRFAVSHAFNREHELCLGEPLQSRRFTISFMLCLQMTCMPSAFSP